MRTTFWAGVLAFGLVAAVGGCDCKPTPPEGQDAGEDGGIDASVITDAGCVASGTACSATVPCCSANCNAGACGVAVFCAPPAATCTSNSGCCSGNCVNGKCGSDRCNDIGAACGNGAECCSGLCTGNVCVAQAAGVCLALGSSCNAADDRCCSQNCRDGVCQRASTCQPTNDVCWSDAECCSLSCSATGGNAGVCIAESGRPASCGYGGQPCNAGSDCCTFVCVDPGSGQKVCQEVSGCQVAGDSCIDDLNCCGGMPNGSVDCNNTRSYCDNGQACRAPGTICGKPQQILADGGIDCARKPDGTCFTVSQETNCCEASGNFKEDATCRLDEVGVPRCFGGGNIAGCPYGYTGAPGCCIETNPQPDGGVGPPCNFSDQCCSGGLCLPGTDGVRRCQVPDCIGLGEACTPGGSGGSACCTGTCSPVNEIDYACQNVPPGSDAGTCSVNGQSCSTSAGCCSKVCDNGTCVEPPSCQPDGKACTADGECCGTSKCIIASGSSTGTCQPGSTCPGAGQACSPTLPCCGEGTTLTCTTATGAACNGTTACTCDFIIGKPQGP